MRKKKEDHENHERWLVSYADFITLLFAFFVVMYSISSVNEGKYRVLSNSMVEAFRHNANGLNIPDGSVKISWDDAREITQPIKSDDGYTVQDETMREIANDILSVMGSLVKQGQVRVSVSSRGVRVDINAGVLFEPGQASLEKKSMEVMKAVARKLEHTPNKIVIEGHTDSIPISTPAYPSNWELSSARASSVVRLFIDNGVNSSRMTVMGFADQKPVETNETEAGRARNRRVTVTVESGMKN